ncbi:MAG: TetR/AcrR family transcriptional regulator [Coriobacteriales bacterium]|jgi:AcrR family transcriptional regulator|nr:TetR/AcrR family transcriptional regulator [Coriobacteriales bacterium]
MEAIDSITSSFIALLTDIPYNQMTVTQICEKASVSKKTFYRHFDSKHELLVDFIKNDIVVPVKNLRELLPLDTIKSAPLLVMERGHHILYEHRALYKNLIENLGKMALVELLTDSTYELNYEIYGNYDLDSINRDFAAYFCAAASAMVQVRWLEQGCPLDEKHMAKLSNTWIMSHWREAGIAAGSK